MKICLLLVFSYASVCHVDSSKGMVAWAKENVISSGLQDKKVRYIVDDVVKFVNREINWFYIKC